MIPFSSKIPTLAEVQMFLRCVRLRRTFSGLAHARSGSNPRLGSRRQMSSKMHLGGRSRGGSPNTRLQRTRRPSLREGRSRRSLGSPLKRSPLGNLS